MYKLACIAVLCLSSIPPCVPVVRGQVSSVPAAAPERWNGSVALPDGTKLDFSVALTGGGGTIDIPMQGAKGLALADVVCDGKAVKFTLKVGGAEAKWARFDAAVDADGKTASGRLHQAGMDLPLTMTKAKEGEAAPTLKRPQEPKPPFPYTEREVSYTNSADGTNLAGTLTVPQTEAGAGKFPAVLLITGSGPQDRNEMLLGHKPFLILADALARHGIAVLRVDDRGVGGSSGKTSTSTTADFVGDVLTGVEFLSAQPEIDAKHIGLIGHSEGGIIAPMAAVKSDKVAFIVMLAGTGLPGRDIIKLQTELIARAGGEKNAKADAEAQDQIFDLVAKGADEATLRAKMKEVAEGQLAAHEKSGDAADREKARTERANLDATIDEQIKELTSPWFRYFLTLDPRESLRKTRCPVLAINGAKDLQVPPKQNLPEIEKALREAGNKDVTVKELPGLNHLFQHCETGSPAEYATIEETMSPEVLELVAGWVRMRAGVGAGR